MQKNAKWLKKALSASDVSPDLCYHFNHRFSHTLTQPRDRQIKVKRHPVVLVNAAVNTNSRGIPQPDLRKKTDTAVLRRYEPLIVHTNQVSDSAELLFIFSIQFGYFPLTKILI